MAKMVPDFVSEDCKSNAERRLFERFRRELSDDFVVLHSLGVAQHRWKLYSEADFVLVHRSAIIVFEVKGGRVARKDGAWFFTDRYGQMHKRKESPMQQVASVTAALRSSAANRFGFRSPQSTVAFGGVTFLPDIEFTEQSPEWELRCVYDISSWQRPLREVIDDCIGFARSEMRRVTGHVPAVLTDSELAGLLEFLRGDFEKVPSLSVAIDGHEQQMVRLAAQQYAILDQTSRNSRMVIEGPAGTGKTLLAMECARRHAAQGKRVLFVCFNRLLAEHLTVYSERNRTSANVSIGTLHRHCLSVLEEAKVKVDPDIETREVYANEIPRLVTEALAKLPSLKLWDVLVVDEGQDIAAHPPFIRALGQLLTGGFEAGTWIWFEDARQRILRQGEEQPFDLGTLNPFYFTLTRNWRNTNEVATFVSIATRFPLAELSGIEGPKVRKVACGTSSRLKALAGFIAELVRIGARPDQIVLLTAAAEKHAVFSGQAEIGGLKLVPFRPRIPPAAGQLRCSSVYRFKGLEAKVVILTDVEDLDAEVGRMISYVGMSRANSALFVQLSDDAHRHFEANRLSFAESVPSG